MITDYKKAVFKMLRKEKKRGNLFFFSFCFTLKPVHPLQSQTKEFVFKLPGKKGHLAVCSLLAEC